MGAAFSEIVVRSGGENQNKAPDKYINIRLNTLLALKRYLTAFALHDTAC
jgi:hypothetical protein